jgi:ribosome silencing factor RsfS/YbeB/iojap
LATTKKPKSSTAAASKPRSGVPRQVVNKPRAAKKPAATKAVAAKKPVSRDSELQWPAPKSAKAPAAKSAAAKKPAARRAPAKTVSKAAAKTPRAKTTGTPVATPPQPKPRKGGKKPAVSNDIVERLRLEVRRALEELKAKDIVELDVRGRTSIADYIVVASGTSTRHVKSVSDEVVKYAKQAGMMPLGVEGQREAEWVLVDLGDIIIHIMLPRVREFYGLERLWSVGGDEASEAAYA